MWACDPAVTGNIVGSYQNALPVFAQSLQTFFAAQCALVGDHLWPPDAIDAVLQDPNYDFIVVGAGSAGSVVANRLSEVPHWKVLLIEAGGNPTLATETPMLFFNTINSPIDWGYRNVPQEGSCGSYETKSCAWPRGKLLGGCSSINGMYYVRGNKLDYDEWAAAGNKGWSYEEVLPYFKKGENFSGILTDEVKKFHGNSGYLNVECGDDAHLFEQIIIKAATETGMKYVYDINGADQIGVTKCATTTKDGVRHSSARAFLSTVKDRKNLHVIKHALVTKILFKPGTNSVSGVTIQKGDKEIIIKAKKEVIISAGAINTPQLLQLSGIGPRKHLEELGIKVKADLPVGENLQDHAYVPVFYKFPGDKNLNSISNVLGGFARYIVEQEGPFATTSPFRVISFMNTTDPQASSPDIQFHYIILPPSVSNLVDVFGNHGFSQEFQKKFRDLNENNFIFMAAAVLLKPKSKGKIILKSTNPTDHPLIYANYFDNQEDLATVIRALKQHSIKLADSQAFKESGFEFEWLDLDGCKNFEKGSDDFLTCWSREVTTSLYHPTSTARMGPDHDKAAVVDSELRVRKVEGLRVIDASIMPEVIRGNTNAPTYMVGEKGSDMIKRLWLAHTEL